MGEYTINEEMKNKMHYVEMFILTCMIRLRKVKVMLSSHVLCWNNHFSWEGRKYCWKDFCCKHDIFHVLSISLDDKLMSWLPFVGGHNRLIYAL